MHNKYQKKIEALLDKPGDSYDLLCRYSSLYNDGKRNTQMMERVCKRIKKLSNEDKAELLDLYDTKIANKASIKNHEEAKYYKDMRKHFLDACILEKTK